MRDHAFKRPGRAGVSSRSASCRCRRGAAYSINRGLWGVTIGGTETLDFDGQHSGVRLGALAGRVRRTREPPSEHRRSRSSRACRSALDGKTLDPVALIEKLEALGAPFGIGRGIHLGDTIIGTKGRVAFEAPAAEMLLTAHRELEKLVLTRRAAAHQGARGQPYGDLVHEGQQLDPVCRDIEALLLSSQERVTGEVHVLLRPGSLFVEGVTSPYSLMAAPAACTARPPASGRRPTRSASRRSSRCPGCFTTRGTRRRRVVRCAPWSSTRSPR